MPNLAPDQIVLANRIHSFAERARPAKALAISRNRIAAVGTHRQIRALANRNTRVIDLRDTTITPGLCDCHTHFFYYALHRANAIDLTTARSRDHALNTLQKQAKRRSYGDWIVGFGCDWNTWPTHRPTAADLDAHFPDRPVLIRSRDAHSVWLNTAALRTAQLRPNTPDPPRGRYVRDARGKLTGIVQEAAIDTLPDPARQLALQTDTRTRRQIDRALANAFAEAHAHGLVGFHTMDDAVSLTHLQRLHTAHHLQLRVAHAIPLANLDAAIQLGLRSGLGDDWLRIGAVKIFSDGALGSQTAYMFSPYPGSQDVGVPVVAGDALIETATHAARHGFALWIHAIGDRAVKECIDAIAAARKVEPTPLPHRIEHAQCIRPADIRRMARLKFVASVQPCHILGDIPTAQRFWPRAQKNAYPLRRLLDAGVTLAAGSDVPIESLDPRRSLFGATQRTNEAQQPPNGWIPDQKISTREALIAFTRGAAAVANADPHTGTLTPGALADLTIWNADPLTHDPQELLDIPIRGCMVNATLYAD